MRPFFRNLHERLLSHSEQRRQPILINSIIYRSRPPNFDKFPTARKFRYGIYPYDECTNTLARCWRAARFPYRCTQLQRTERSRFPREYFKRSCRAGTRDSRSKNGSRRDVRSSRRASLQAARGIAAFRVTRHVSHPLMSKLKSVTDA